jgi:hypothetical protein
MLYRANKEVHAQYLGNAERMQKILDEMKRAGKERFGVSDEDLG